MFFQGSQPSMVENSLIIKRLPKFRQVKCRGLRHKSLLLKGFQDFIYRETGSKIPFRHKFASRVRVEYGC